MPRGFLTPYPYTSLKPAGFEDYKTRGEVAKLINRDRHRLREAEKVGKIPAPIRVRMGKHMIRLYSPADVEKIVKAFQS